jgi:hypothetical protein
MSILSLGGPKDGKLVKCEFLRFKAQSGSKVFDPSNASRV